MRSNPNLNKLLSLALAMLIATLPVASANMLTGWVVEGGAGLATLDIEASVPEYSHTSTITIQGKTKGKATVHAFVNEIRQRVITTGLDGNFKISALPLRDGENKIRLEAREGENATTKEYTVVFDGKPPIVRLTSEIPDSTKANSVTVAGDVNEKVAIKWRVVHKTDTTPPDVITNLRLNKAEPNSIELVWDPSPATDLKEYLVERDGKRIATTPVPSYSDTGLKPGSQYSYSISGVDTSCNIGTSADILTATKTGGTSITPAATPEINLSCETPYQTTTAENTFSINVPLTEGINDLEIILEDSAGNKEVIEHRVRMDNTAPKLVETNLDKISPSYVPDITIKGKLDEQATVLVYINDEQKPSEYKVTDPDGTFSIKTRLRTDVRIKKGATKTTVEVGEGWANRIRLEAVDIAGNKATFGPYDVDFLLCGLGTWWSANIGEALPNILLPRLMVQGIQQIGIPFNITYIGTHDVKLGRIDVRPIMLSKGAEKDYDHDWVQVNAYTRAKGKKNAVGYIQIQFENVNPLPEKPEAGPNEKERALSGHRRGECLVPGTGCVKLFLQMEIQFQEIVAYKPAEPGMPIVTPKIEPRMQKVCIPIEVAIDQTIPSDIIPKGLLKTTISAIDKAISLIDKVLKPITTIGEYVLYGCLASNVWLVLNWFTEKMACEGSALIDAFAGAGGGWNKAVAEAGLCEPAYKDNPAKMQKCMTCQNKIESRKKFEMNVMHGLCDRVGCPSAPTLSYYIKSNVGNAEPLEEISASVQKLSLIHI